MKVQREVAWITLSRLVAFLCTFYILFVDISGSIATNESMQGRPRKMINPDNHYTQEYMLIWLESFVRPDSGRIEIPNALQALNHSFVRMLYLDAIDDSKNAVTRLKFYENGCRQPMDSDHIYQPPYSTQLLHNVLDHQVWHRINLTTSWIILDCSYQGRTLGDTTAYKVHVLDQTSTNLTTIFIQTMMMNRPQKEWFVSCGTATISTMELALVSWNGRALASTQTAVYHVMAAAEFPFENIPFEHVILSNPDSDTGAWDAVMTRTGERVSLCGSTGTYRYSPRTQGRFDYFVWQLPPNPIEYLERIQWVNVVYSIDSWAWVRYLIDMSISLILAVNTIVGVVASINIWREQHFVWIPDVYPAIRTEVVIRSILLLISCIVSRWWHIFEYCMVKDTARQSWGYTEFVYDAVVRSDLQVFFLSFFHLLAHALHLRVHLIVIVSIYYSCYMCQDEINATVNLCQSASSAWLYENYMLNTIMATGGMDLWAFHENYETSWAVMAAQLAWYVLAWCLAFCYITVVACYTLVYYKDPNKIVAPESSIHDFVAVGLEPILNYKHYIRLFTQTVLCRRKSRHGPQLIIVRSHQADPRRTILFNVEATNFEKSVRRRYFRTHGFIAPLSERVVQHNEIYATHSLIWLLGFVIVKDDYLVCVADVPYLWLNWLLRWDIHYVYGYPLTKEKVTIEANAVRITSQDYTFVDLFSITIRPLR